MNKFITTFILKNGDRHEITQHSYLDLRPFTNDIVKSLNDYTFFSVGEDENQIRMINKSEIASFSICECSDLKENKVIGSTNVHLDEPEIQDIQEVIVSLNEWCKRELPLNEIEQLALDLTMLSDNLGFVIEMIKSDK